MYNGSRVIDAGSYYHRVPRPLPRRQPRLRPPFLHQGQDDQGVGKIALFQGASRFHHVLNLVASSEPPVVSPSL